MIEERHRAAVPDFFDIAERFPAFSSKFVSCAWSIGKSRWPGKSQQTRPLSVRRTALLRASKYD
ncbi:MAG TPA: hypothetical protein VJS63_06520 [Bradyrhizobium sp.]|nr:hypothetical protein [Bradyrhizobium sp.]